MLLTVAFLAMWNMAVYWRLRKPWAATHLEIFLNLAVDNTVLTLLLYWAGGASNPFVFIYLVPIAIAAAALPARHVWAMSLMCAAFYSCLMLFYTPLPPVPERFGGDFNLHVIGMWVNFILSAVLMAVFVAGIAGAVRQKDRSLSKAREEALNNEKIVALGTLAAGVAHEISTPLSTMTVVVDELIDSLRGDEALSPDLDLLRKQIDVCKERLRDLLASAGHTRSEGGHAMPLRGFCDRLLDRWQVIRPEIELTVSYKEPFQDVTILAEQTLAQSITNLLNNAADASLENGSEHIAVVLYSADQRLEILIDDEGKGITQAQTEQASRAFFSTKRSGFGIGLVLANASLGRLGGEVLLKGAPKQGTRTEISLPLRDLIISS
jgi:two-component system sensor histidine kinase RegB